MVGEGGPVSDAAPDSHTTEVPCARILRAARISGSVTMDVTMRPRDGPGGAFEEEEEEEEGDEEEMDEDNADVVVVVVVVADVALSTDSQPPVAATARWRATSARCCLRRARASDGGTLEHASVEGEEEEVEVGQETADEAEGSVVEGDAVVVMGTGEADGACSAQAGTVFISPFVATELLFSIVRRVISSPS